MLTYILRRMLLMIPTLIGMTLILFSVVRFAPGLTTGGGAFSAGGELQDQQARDAAERAMKKRLHLVDSEGRPISIPMQYALWLKDTVQGNFGESVQYNTPVSQLLRERLPVTVSLNLIAISIVYLIAIPGGMLASVKRGKLFDVSWSFLTLAMYSLPSIWIGAMLVGFMANSRYLGWFPAEGIHSTNTSWYTSFEYAGDYMWHLVLPVVTLSYGGFAFLTKLKRAAMLDNLNQDYVRTARAKGLSEFVVVTRHVFRNSLLPLITVFAGVLPGMLGGSIVVESIFSLKGMGDLMITAVMARDLPIIQAVAFIAAVLSLISLLLADIGFAVADPRVSYD